ncbi:MAG TPA: serine/threonine protein kinase [Desulfobacterales bacterium]|nr:serine/threonine protein kinase [Desulfobacterales bacterium]
MDSVQVFDEGQAVEIIMQVARALDYIDSRGAVHRAVHPRNIFIAPNQVAKLAGFGLARNLIDRAPTRSTARVEIEYYLSPEEARNEPTDIRSDIYSLGAILYHMVTGRPPFIGKGPVQVLARRVTDDPPHPKMFNPAISDALARILLRMLAREATERYSHPRELLEDLALLKLSGPSIELERDYEREASVSRFRGRHLPGFFRRSRGKAFSMGSFLFLGIAAAALFSSLGLGLYLFGR